jgi:two-component system sensor histidine kinase TctE
LSVILVWLGLKSGMAPLEQLRRRVAARPAHDLSPLPPRDAPSEIAPLIAAFNELLMRIERSNLAQKRFIANAAHQLRTPLAGIRTQTELALRDDSPERIRDALERIASGSSKSTHLITQLLALARAEANTRESLALQAVDLVALAGEAVREAYGVAAAKHIDLGLEAPEHAVHVSGQPALLQEMLSNLIDNAIRYTPGDGQVTVRVINGRHAALEVEDSGIGIPDAERELVFERFYRGANQAEAGTGIGLAIVREIVDRHQATIRVMVSPERQGTCMRIDFPSRPPVSTT